MSHVNGSESVVEWEPRCKWYPEQPAYLGSSSFTKLTDIVSPFSMSTTSPSLKSEMLCATMWTWYLRRFASPPKRNKSSGAASATSRKVAKPSLLGKKIVASRLGSSRRSTIYSCYHIIFDTHHSKAKNTKSAPLTPAASTACLAMLRLGSFTNTWYGVVHPVANWPNTGIIMATYMYT